MPVNHFLNTLCIRMYVKYVNYITYIYLYLYYIINNMYIYIHYNAYFVRIIAKKKKNKTQNLMKTIRTKSVK